MEDDNDIDSWADALAGRATEKTAGGVPTTSLRTIVHDEVLRASGQDSAEVDRLLRRLEDEQLLPRQPETRGSARLVHSGRFQAANGPRFLIAASLVALSVGVGYLLYQPQIEPPQEIPRGFTGAVKVVADSPESRATELAVQLSDLGFQVKRTKSDGRIVLEFDVGEADLPKLAHWYEALGGYPSGPGTYRVVVAPSSEEAKP